MERLRRSESCAAHGSIRTTLCTTQVPFAGAAFVLHAGPWRRGRYAVRVVLTVRGWAVHSGARRRTIAVPRADGAGRGPRLSFQWKPLTSVTTRSARSEHELSRMRSSQTHPMWLFVKSAFPWRHRVLLWSEPRTAGRSETRDTAQPSSRHGALLIRSGADGGLATAVSSMSHTHRSHEPDGARSGR